ncbi:hypothetical protein AB0B04_33025 [Streptomyces xinghaiensis]|uniref:hypothetical protein n=1 Tax=Kocuria rhizophila TaxID=72000 RepID=UPI000A498E8D|nr:hypothetical protein [Kocuria rhizophila]
METTTYTTDQEAQLATVLAAHHAHATSNDGWIGAGHVDAPEREWPQTVTLHHQDATGATRSEFPGMTRETLYAGLTAAGYFRANLGGVDVYGRADLPF